MYVQKEYRGNGLALQLIQTVKERARQHGLTYLCLGTNSSMEKTKRYYEKNGWTPIDRHSLPSNVLAAFNIADDAFFKLTLECIPQVP
ncbi:hypothetical protein DM01DRAFT_1334351 [Hesseltinella vesiculosa]|uniref:N-acetyltransferase domain-containing protein n=1 Tax=Hesseltinella vesiculosa TaxID=101127 RepID=A0A1X2GN06_9FUNG|nr:hypothetical protein DM01DRAFT_1334351 [Hesseltinella vesiculosa]